MKLNLRLVSCPLALVIVFAEASSVLTDARQSQTSSPAKRAQARAAQGKIWKSETTGKEYRVKVEKDRFYAEWSNVPPESAKQGLYIRTECRPAGTKWVGTTQAFLLCPHKEEAGAKKMNGCHITLRFEVDSITPDRITGRGESLRRWDCDACKVFETGWGNFVWVPKQKGAHPPRPSRPKGTNKT